MLTRSWLLVLSFALLFGCSPPQAQCRAATCSGCCDEQDQCQLGTSPSACGQNARRCDACVLGAVCALGVCTVTSTSTGGGGAGGGAGLAGGAAAGGEAGGATAGGDAGGVAGGSAGGGTAGGASAGGSVGGGAAGGSQRDAGPDPRCAGTLVTCGASCVDLDADFSNCGRCGNACGPGLVCNFGTCRALPPDCVTGGGCAPGYFCNPTTRACQAGCRLATDCPSGATCSNTACVCPTGQHACGQRCVSDSATTSCGSRCELCSTPTGGTATCSNGACGITCDQGRRLCSGACPVCSTPANGSDVCSGTTCDFTCATGFHRCQSQCASNVSPMSCGSSSCTPCVPPANATSTCDGGACGFKCLSGFRFCSGACAACNTPANATATCNGASCGFACDTGYHACSTQCLSNTSPASCGTSCTPCPAAPANATATCTAGTCGWRCNPGFFTCGAACCPATELAVGWDHACVRLSDGSVSCWGSNSHSQLAIATSTLEANLPQDVTALGTVVTHVAAGGYGSCAIISDAGTYCWGENDFGQAGSGGTAVRTSPTRITAHQSPIASLGMGRSHVCSVTSTGAVRCWGDNSAGQLAFGAITAGATEAGAGSLHSCALVGTQVRCWGDNAFGQLGAGDFMARTAPFTVPQVTARRLATGSNFTCAVLEDAGLACWGSNASGQLGTPGVDGGVSASPLPVVGPWAATAAAAGALHACLLTTQGAVFCWGTNAWGQLGDGTQTPRAVPTPVSGLTSGVVAIGVGFDHSCALLATGGVKCWGRNNQSQLGDGTNAANRLVPVDVLSR